MKFFFRFASLALCLAMIAFMVVSCKDKPKGKVEITEKEFQIVKDGKFSYSVDVSGKIRNTGPVDVKNVVVTGYCRSCNETMISNTWFVTQAVKSADQVDTIGYLAAGAEEDFKFNGIAYYYSQTSEAPQQIPPKLDVVVESFETVQ